jgi:hypothetical protein
VAPKVTGSTPVGHPNFPVAAELSDDPGHMEIGIYTFGELGPNTSHAERTRQLVEEMALADQVGLDVFGVGEHHRPD